MATEIIMALVGVFCTAISSAITFVLTKKEYTAKVESQQIDNISNAFSAYKKMMEETLASQNQRIGMLQKENETLRSQFHQLQSQMMNLLIGKKLGIGDFDLTEFPSPNTELNTENE